MRTFLLLPLLLSAITTAGAQQRGASITVIAPTFGAPGTTVSIRGAGFSGFDTVSRWVRELANEPPPGAVEFNGVPGEILFWQDDLITVKVPKGTSSGPIRVILPQARVAITGDEFEVYYSIPGERSVKSIEFPPERSRSNEDSSSDDTFLWRLHKDEHAAPDSSFLINPWFSSLSPGERTFLGEQGFTNTFLFGNPFTLGRKQSFLFGDRFRSGRDGFSHDGFDRFPFQRLFFGDFLFRRSRNTSIRPFGFFFGNSPSTFHRDGHIFRR
jgi:hypothetical protein